MARGHPKDSGEVSKQKKTEESQKNRDNRIDGHIQTIAKVSGVTPNALRQLFNNSKSQRFWAKLQDLVSKQQYPWEDIYNTVVPKAIDLRGRPELSVKPERLWQPAHVQAAETALQQGSASSHPGQIPDLTTTVRSGTPEVSEVIPEGEPGVRVLFCGIGKPLSIENEGGIKSLEVVFENPFKGDVFDSLTPDVVEKLMHVVGDGLSYYGKNEETGEEIAFIHNIALSLLWAQHTKYMGVEFHNWDAIDRLIDENFLIPHDKPHQKVFVFHHMQQKGWAEGREAEEEWSQSCSLEQFCTVVGSVAAGSTDKVICYPSIDETRAYLSATSDIYMLDLIAANDAPDRFKWRPKVCFGQKGPCAMDDYEGDILVRGGSRSMRPIVTYHGRHDDRDLVGLLDCDATCAPTNKRRMSGYKPKFAVRLPETKYFHQELASTLKSWGEIIVFIVKDHVFARAMTKPGATAGDVFVTVLNEECFIKWTDKEQAKAKMEELDQFCIWWRNYSLKNHLKEFESLDVAAVFHIGISTLNPDGMFFIHHVPRWPTADFYSAWLSPYLPYDNLCKAIGQRFAVKYGAVIQPERDESGGSEGGF